MQDPALPHTPARDALRRACAALDLAESAGRPYAMSQALAQVGHCYARLRAVHTAEVFFEMALKWARVSGAADMVVERLCELADVAAARADLQDAADPGSGHAARERARDHAFEASQRAATVADASCEAQLLLRVGQVLERCGDHAEAIDLQTRALSLMADGQATDVRQLPGLGRLADS